MEAFVFWLSVYWRQVVGFAGAVIGTQLLLVLSMGSPHWGLILLCLMAAWYSAVLGVPYGGRPKNILTPYYRYRVYWIGLAVFVIGCAVPIVWDLVRFGVRDRNVIAMAVVVFAAVLAVTKAWSDASGDARKE